jgi:hypothetical protein
MTAKKRGTGSDLAKFDAHEITPEEYEEIPELTEEFFARGDIYIGDRLVHRGRSTAEAAPLRGSAKRKAKKPA